LASFFFVSARFGAFSFVPVGAGFTGLLLAVAGAAGRAASAKSAIRGRSIFSGDSTVTTFGFGADAAALFAVALGGGALAFAIPGNGSLTGPVGSNCGTALRLAVRGTDADNAGSTKGFGSDRP
jgi:hypothetical protein